jgi:DNA polymerase V
MQYSRGARQYFINSSASTELQKATAYLPDIMSAAIESLRRLYKEGCGYRKTLVSLMGLEPAEHAQLELFEDSAAIERKKRVMSSFDALNFKYGRKTLHVASADLAGGEKSGARTGTPWLMKREMMSPAYTTNIHEVPLVKC